MLLARRFSPSSSASSSFNLERELEIRMTPPRRQQQKQQQVVMREVYGKPPPMPGVGHRPGVGRNPGVGLDPGSSTDGVLVPVPESPFTGSPISVARTSPNSWPSPPNPDNKEDHHLVQGQG